MQCSFSIPIQLLQLAHALYLYISIHNRYNPRCSNSSQMATSMYYYCNKCTYDQCCYFSSSCARVPSQMDGCTRGTLQTFKEFNKLLQIFYYSNFIFAQILHCGEHYILSLVEFYPFHDQLPTIKVRDAIISNNMYNNTTICRVSISLFHSNFLNMFYK